MKNDGELQRAPFPPGGVYMAGTDPKGIDLLSLILYGDRTTISVVLAVKGLRLMAGLLCGVLSGWFARSWFDRVVLALIQLFADFPEWGALMGAAWRRFRASPWLQAFPAALIAISVPGFNLPGFVRCIAQWTGGVSTPAETCAHLDLELIGEAGDPPAHFLMVLSAQWSRLIMVHARRKPAGGFVFSQASDWRGQYAS